MTEELVWSSDSELEDTVPEPAPTPEPIKEEVIQTKPKKPRSEAQIAGENLSGTSTDFELQEVLLQLPSHVTGHVRPYDACGRPRQVYSSRGGFFSCKEGLCWQYPRQRQR